MKQGYKKLKMDDLNQKVFNPDDKMNTVLHKWKKFVLYENGFSYKKEFYTFNDIESLEFASCIINYKLYAISAGTNHEARLFIHLNNGRNPIEIDYFIPKMPSSYTEDKARKVFDIYTTMAKLSFGYRIKKYTVSLDNNNYFIYDDKKFYQDGVLVAEGVEINIHDYRLYNDPYCVIVKIPKPKKSFNFLRKDPSIFISTVKDQDCFFALLRSMYDIYWK